MIVFFSLLSLAPSVSKGAEQIATRHQHDTISIIGPIFARIISIIDGDTIKVRAYIWIDQFIEIKVRLLGVDTPETYRPRCSKERQRGKAAAAFLGRLLDDSSTQVWLHDVRAGKYNGRVLARVTTLTGVDIAQALIKNRHGRPYTGRKRLSWCSPAPMIVTE